MVTMPAVRRIRIESRAQRSAFTAALRVRRSIHRKEDIMQPDLLASIICMAALGLLALGSLGARGRKVWI